MDFLLYGAYGYTGRLITRMAAEHGLRPLLSGRNESKLIALGAEFHFEYVAVDLADTEALDAALRRVPVVLHAAGPFEHTADAMHAACLRTKTHYLDITGEIRAFGMAAKRDAEAREAGIMLMPGVGFDVVPTDCMAAFLKELLPDANELVLAFAWSKGMLSHGTAKTMLMGMGSPGAVREHGKLTPVPPAYRVRSFPFTAKKTLQAVTIPWGDVFTAYFTTGIPNIETYFASPPSQIRQMKLSRYLGPILRSGFVQNYLRKQIEAKPAGPDDARRAASETYIYGEAKSPSGKIVKARMRTPEGYTLTAIMALRITKRVLGGDFEAGYRTPAGLYGKDLVMEVSGVTREEV